MDANLTLVLLMAVASVAGLVRLLRMPVRQPRWIAIYAVLGLAAAVGWFAWRDLAGYVAVVWFVPTILVPGIALRRLNALVTRQDFRAAARLARWIARIQPSEVSRTQATLIEGIAFAAAGEFDRATALLDRASGNPQLRQRAQLQILRFRADWPTVVACCQAMPDHELATDATSVILYCARTR